MSKTSVSIDTKDISQISKGDISQNSNIAQILSNFNTKLSNCPKQEGKYVIDKNDESELLKIYSGLPWTEQLKLRASNLFSYCLFYLHRKR